MPVAINNATSDRDLFEPSRYGGPPCKTSLDSTLSKLRRRNGCTNQKNIDRAERNPFAKRRRVALAAKKKKFRHLCDGSLDPFQIISSPIHTDTTKERDRNDLIWVTKKK